MKLSQIWKYGGLGIGIVAMLALVSQHPLHVAFIGIGAVVYFVGKYFEKEGK